MKKICCATLLLFVISFSFAQVKAPERIELPNGWRLTPVGKSLQLGDLPLNIALSPNGKYAAVTNNGQSTQTIQLIDLSTQSVLDNIEIAKSWLGLVFSADNKSVYASGGNDNRINQYAIVANKLQLKDSFILDKPWPVKVSPSGITLDDARHLLYVVTKENNSLYVIDTKTHEIKQHLQLDGEAYTCMLSKDKKELYITCWGCDQLVIYNTVDQKISGSVKVGDNPNDICLSNTGKWLYVANANDNSVSVIDIKQRKVVETLNAALYPQSVPGSTTNSVALSADNKTLYIANADNNCLAVFDVSTPGDSKSKGFIPVGWYPTCVRVAGNNILVANGKGFTSMANPYGPNPVQKNTDMGFQKGDTKHEVQYIGGLFKGTLSIIKTPTPELLSHYSQWVYANTPYHKDKELVSPGETGNPIPMHIGDPSPIKYVFYIIKENRTYDQVLGDMPEGNGDTSLCLFGEKVTPNLHALARNFVLLDNFYVDAEVSADGHNWSMGGYADDYLEKTWPTDYGGRGGTYDAEGNREIANNKGGFIWDHCARAGISYRTYGEFADDYKPNLPVLKNHYCTYYTSWDQHVRDTSRVYQWKRDFDSLVAAKALPHLNTLRIINDHTEGLSKGRPTPFAHCADNDLAVGMFVDFLSHSSVWSQSVVFVLEDDAQDGPDHVDAHRSTAYIISPYIKRSYVDHTMYSTTGMLRTMELILGLPPMSQYDAAATPMWRCFQSTPDLTPFTHLPNQWDLNDKNTVENAWQRKSETFDFSKEDRVPDREFTEVIWKAVKGADAVVPAPKRAAFVQRTKEKDDDD